MLTDRNVRLYRCADAELVIYGDHNWPSHCQWFAPGTLDLDFP